MVEAAYIGVIVIFFLIGSIIGYHYGKQEVIEQLSKALKKGMDEKLTEMEKKGGKNASRSKQNSQ